MTKFLCMYVLYVLLIQIKYERTAGCEAWGSGFDMGIEGRYVYD